MERTIPRTPRDIQVARDNYLTAIQPYVEKLAKIKAIKPIPRMIIDVKTGEVVQDAQEDWPIEAEIKKIIKDIEDKTIGPYLTN